MLFISLKNNWLLLYLQNHVVWSWFNASLKNIGIGSFRFHPCRNIYGRSYKIVSKLDNKHFVQSYDRVVNKIVVVGK